MPPSKVNLIRKADTSAPSRSVSQPRAEAEFRIRLGRELVPVSGTRSITLIIERSRIEHNKNIFLTPHSGNGILNFNLVLAY